jgi:protein-S-isoprenylcysteine O-methyltransferase Ste14
MAKLLVQFFAAMTVLGALLLGAAGTIAWIGGWVLIAAFGGGALAMALWLKRFDPALLRERSGQGSKEKPGFDRILLPLANIALLAWLILMGLDARWHGATQMPLWANLAGGGLILAAFALVVLVMRENTFATTYVRTQPERGQHVIATGPYRIVRHPMYAAATLAYAAMPLALGSKWGFAGVPVLVGVLAIRTWFEERLLKRELQGYCDYTAKVRYRFVPLVW